MQQTAVSMQFKTRRSHTHRRCSQVRRWVLQAKRRAHRKLQKVKRFEAKGFLQRGRHRGSVDCRELEFFLHYRQGFRHDQVKRYGVQQSALAAQHVTLHLRQLVTRQVGTRVCRGRPPMPQPVGEQHKLG